MDLKLLNDMETVFEHSINDAEIKELEVIDTLMGETEHNYKEWISMDNANADIMRLYLLRGNKDAAKTYFNKIKSEEVKSAFRLA